MQLSNQKSTNIHQIQIMLKNEQTEKIRKNKEYRNLLKNKKRNALKDYPINQRNSRS
jgi:hypothetical protein